MANAKSYPASLPKPLLSSAKITEDAGYVNSTMASGLLRQRQTQQYATGRQSVEVPCTQFQAARLRAFLDGLGGAAFDMDLNTTYDPDNQISTCSVRWMGVFRQAESIRSDFKICQFEIFIEQADLTYSATSEVWDMFDEVLDLDAYAQIFENAVEGIPAL